MYAQSPKSRYATGPIHGQDVIDTPQTDMYGDYEKADKKDLAPMKVIQDNFRESVAYTICIVTIVACYFLVSQGDWSFMMTVATLISFTSFACVAGYVYQTRSVAGLSSKMLECYAVVIILRLSCVVPVQAYLPYDATGDFIYQFVEGCTACVALGLVFACRVMFKQTYNAEADQMKHWILMVAALVLGLIVHANHARNMFIDMLWAASMYLEIVANLPQLTMFQKERKVHPWTAHFLAAQTVQKFISFCFWTAGYKELVGPKWHAHRDYVGVFVAIVTLIQLLFMGDFMIQYIRCLRQGLDMTSVMLAPEQKL